MRAAQFSEFIGPEKLGIEKVPDPTPGEGENVIRVAAVGLNFFDTIVLPNRYHADAPPFAWRRNCRNDRGDGTWSFGPCDQPKSSPRSAAMAPGKRWPQRRAMRFRFLVAWAMR